MGLKLEEIPNSAHILLVIPPPFLTLMPHLGIAYLSSSLKANGFKVSVFDLGQKLHNAATNDLKYLWQLNSLNNLFCTESADKIYTSFEVQINKFIDDFMVTDIKVIGFTVNIISIFVANRIAKAIKNRDSSRLIIFGGPAAFFKYPRELARPSFTDIFVIGEGENVLLKILDTYYSGRRISSSPGILLAQDLDRYQSVPAPLVNNLDEINFPSFSDFDLTEYNQGSNYKPLPLLLSRGCINRCSYCIDCIMWPKYRSRSPANIMAEIDYQMRNNNTKAFELIDLACNGNLRQLSGLCDLIISSGYKFSWVSYAIIRKNMDYALLVKMRKAGCNTLIYGVENGSDSILKKMGKPYTAKEASEIIRITHEVGIRTNINIIVGFPGEKEDDFKKTIDFIYENKDFIDEVTNISGCTLFPEAPLGRDKKKYGVILQDGIDQMFFIDANGLDRQGRMDRISRLSRIIDELDLSNAIVNRPALNPKIKTYGREMKILKFLFLITFLTAILLYILYFWLFRIIYKHDIFN